jgi:glucosyl-3-phosphoglycerate phosphatase
MAELLVLRHAQSEWNATGRWQGQADPPLSPEGRHQAREAATRLAHFAGEPPFTQVLSSDLRRASETAELLRAGLGVPGHVTEDRELRERDLGSWSGLTRDQIDAGWPGEREALRDGRLEGPPGGEATSAFRERAARAVAAAAGRGGRLLVVAHGGLIRALLDALGATAPPVSHCSGIWLAARAGGLSPGRWLELLGEEIEAPQQAV